MTDRNVRISEDQIAEIKKLIPRTGQTIKGFISVAIEKELRRQK